MKSKHEEGYFHIRKRIVKAFFPIIFGFLFFWWGLYVFEQYRVEYPYIMLVPYSVCVIGTFIVYWVIDNA